MRIAFFLCKIRFITHMFIIWGRTHNHKNYEELTIWWRWERVNTYGQPDRKISVFLRLSSPLSWIPIERFVEEGGDATFCIKRSLNRAMGVEQLRQPIADFRVAEVGHVLQDLVPVLNELPLADGVVSIFVQLLEKSQDPCVRVVDVEREMVVENINKLQLPLGHRTIMAEVQLVVDGFSVCHGEKAL